MGTAAGTTTEWEFEVKNMELIKAKLDPYHIPPGLKKRPEKRFVESASAIFDTLRQGIPYVFPAFLFSPEYNIGSI
jgi:hypothetical protein